MEDRMLNHILVPLDGSTLAECVLPHVLAIAPVMNARVTLLHVLERTSNGRETSAVDPVDWHLRKHKLERYLEQIATRLDKSGMSVERIILEGNPADGVIEFARNSNVDLIALSTHGFSGLSGWNVSSVVQKILLRSYKSTLLVRAYRAPAAGSTKIRYRRLFVGLDCSARAEYILPIAINLAQSYKSQLILETVVEKPRTVGRLPLSGKEIELIDQLVEMNHQAASHYFKQLLTQFALQELKLKTHISVGDNTIAVLHDMAEEANADLVMLVAHGQSGERRWPYGSVTTSFIAYGNTPLMIMQDLSAGDIQMSHAELAVRGAKGH
jgi:nucleotide-binding universal stress UspA family protein